MPPEIQFHRLAAREYLQAAARYRAISAELGTDFEQQIEIALQKINENPTRWPVALRSYRWIRTRRFPYLLFFHVADDSTVLIMAVAHARRRWGYWRRRRPS